jgi:hypothetical protein
MTRIRSSGRRTLRCLIGFAAAALALAGCESLRVEPANRDPAAETRENAPSRLLGDGGLSLLSFGGRSRDSASGGGGIGVNSFLWRASLDTVAFMPLASADPFGGVIITDWYAPPETPDERFKVMVYILGGQLRADGVRAQVFRQRRGGPALASANGRGRGAGQAPRPATGDWMDVAVEPNVPTELENAILTRARQLRIDAAARS